MTTEQKIQYIAYHYGYEPQSRQLIKEMAELTVALNKAWRSRHDYVETPNTDYVDYENILEEMADTLIRVWQIKYLLGVGEGVCVICKECGCRTITLVDGNLQGKPCGGAIHRVIDKWNRRADNE